MTAPPLRLLLAVVLVALAALALAACGGKSSSTSGASGASGNASSSASAGNAAAHGEAPSSSEASSASEAPGASSHEVVAQVGSSPITKAEVNHWMQTFANNDFNTVSQIAAHGYSVPQGLVSDPPNYARCVSSLEAAAAKSPSHRARETGVQLLGKCRELYQALKAQATNYLIGVQRTIALGREVGVRPTDAEVQKLFDQFKNREYHTEAAFQNYLATSKRNVADILVAMRIDVISNGLIKQMQTQQGRARINEAEQRWTQRTSCKPGYVVEGCKQYNGGGLYPSSPPSSVLMEQVAALSSGRCVNTEACAKQAGK